eukprot:3999778-Pyramimonas_sp.AAC.1
MAPMTVESPASVDDWRNAASCWLLPAITNMVGIDGVDLIAFDQCMTGQTAARPTALLTIQVPEILRTIGTTPQPYWTEQPRQRAAM